MIRFLIKAEQLGLFDKLVPIAASVSKKGVVTPAHQGIRHVRPPEAPHAQRHAKADEKAAAAAKPAPKPVSQKPAAPEAGDLFAERAPVPVDPFAKIREAERQRKRRAKDLAAENPSLRMTHPDGRRGLVGPDLTRPGLARWTRFDADGPVGHNEHDTVEAAILEALTYGFEPEVAKGIEVVDIPAFDPDKAPKFGVEAGITKARRRGINAEAAALVEEQTEFSPEDLALLRQYSGNGGCGDSLNEYYTDPKVCGAMWHVLRRLGLPFGATVLEPSCATGAFFETAPAGTQLTGVELDGVSAKIGQVLHPRHEIQNSSLEAFAVQDTRQFDAVIGNPPYGLRGGLLKEDKPDLSTAQAYFVDTSIDKTKPGGITALVIPTGIIDGSNMRAFRQRILAKAEFLGALRMPRTAFEASHTEVTTDVAFFRKRPQDVANALGVVSQGMLQTLGVWDEEFLGGGYFTESGAANVLGNMVGDWRAEAAAKRGEEGGGITVEGSMVGVPEAIAAFEPAPAPERTLTLGDILAAAPDDKERERIRSAAARMPYDNAKRGDTRVVNGVTYVLEGEPLRWHRLDEFQQSLAVTAAQDLANDIGRAIDGGDVPDLADRVRAYIAEHGVPSKNANLMIAAGQDRTLYHLIGAVKPDGSLSDVVEGRKAAKMESAFDTAATALALEAGEFTPDQLAARWAGGDSEAALDQLYASADFALDPTTGGWTTLDQYLTGDLWPKLDEAKAAAANEESKPEDRAKYERQAAKLEETIDPKSLEDVEVLLNSGFLPLHVMAAYYNERKNASDSHWIREQADAEITFDRGVYHFTGGTHVDHLLERYLNRTGVKKDDLPTIARMNEAFKAWLCASRYRDEVENLYNRKFRGFRQRAYSNEPFTVPGLNDEGLKNYTWSGLRWLLEAKKGICAADVGLGKTVRALMLARMLKVTGQARKPLIVVPKSVLANWLKESQRWFPGSTVLTIGETYTRAKNGDLKGVPDDAATRNRKFHDLTQNEYDFVLISQPAWNDLELDPKIEERLASEDFWTQRAESLRGVDDKNVKKAKEAYEQSLAKRAFGRRSDAIFFDQLGVDAIIGDEMHAYKNLYAAKNRFGDSPKFLGGQGLSKRALDMFFKTKWLRDANGGNNVYGLTATPTKNSPLEIYSMLSHIAPEAFENIGIRNSEEFLDRFCEFKMQNVLNTRQGIEEKVCVTGFKNLDELREIMRRYIDRTTAEEVGLVLPKRDDREHLLDMSPKQKEVYEELRAQAAAAAGNRDATGEDHIFSIMHRMGQAALDLEIMRPDEFAGARSPLLEALAENAAEAAPNGGQVIFCDTNAAHEKIASLLAAKGIPRERVGIINAEVAASSAKRQNIADAFNARKLWAVVGNTATMGEGINLQMGTTDIHHADLPWEPASMQQRNGRGLRQGNIAEAVAIHSYLPKGSFYGYRWQAMLAKKDWQDLLWNGGDKVENLAMEGAMSRDDMMVMLSENPDEARKTLDANKTRATEQFHTAKYEAAASEFKRFKAMQASFAGLKNKETQSAERLKVRLARLRIALDDDDHFHAKDALDSNEPIMIQPKTGMAFKEGVAFEVKADDGSAQVTPGKYVVTHVPTVRAADEAEEVYVRPYGSTRSGGLALKLADLGRNVSALEYSAEAEHAEISKGIADAMASGAKAVTGFKALQELPPAAVSAAHDALQTAVKAGMRDYSFNTGYGDIAMMNKAGELVALPAYNARAALDDHDVMLPTDENREKAINAFMADQAAVKFQRETPAGRHGRGVEPRMAVKYPSANTSLGAGHNQWATMGKTVFGDQFEHDASQRFNARQFEAARHAKTFADAALALAPTAIGPYGSMGAWSRRAFAVLWAQAKRQGVLDKPMREVLPGTRLPDEMFSEGLYNDRRSVTGLSTATALIKLAADRGQHDLAAAMVVSSGLEPAAKVKALLRMRMADVGVVAALGHVVAKNPDLAKRAGRDFEMTGPGQFRTLGEVLADARRETGENDEGERDAA